MPTISDLILTLALAGMPSHLQSAQPKPNYIETTRATRPVAEAYFAAYMAKDWNTLGSHLAEQANFLDPSAQLVFPGALQQGKSAVLKFFREGYEGTVLKFKPERVWFSGHYGLFEGKLDWTSEVAPGKTIHMKDVSFLVTLRVEDGKVVEHRDFADYHPFLAEMKKLREITSK